jgi:hypothetical protein
MDKQQASERIGTGHRRRRRQRAAQRRWPRRRRAFCRRRQLHAPAAASCNAAQRVAPKSSEGRTHEGSGGIGALRVRARRVGGSAQGEVDPLLLLVHARPFFAAGCMCKLLYHFSRCIRPQCTAAHTFGTAGGFCRTPSPAHHAQPGMSVHNNKRRKGAAPPALVQRAAKAKQPCCAEERRRPSRHRPRHARRARRHRQAGACAPTDAPDGS